MFFMEELFARRKMSLNKLTTDHFFTETNEGVRPM